MIEFGMFHAAALAGGAAAGLLTQLGLARWAGIEPAKRKRRKFDSERFVNMVGDLIPLSQDGEEAARESIDRSGQQMTPQMLWASRVILAAAGFAVGTLAAGQIHASLSFLAIPVCMGLFALLPQLYLMQAGRKWRDSIERDLPNALDLLAIAVAAGTSFDMGIRIVASRTEGPLADAFKDVCEAAQYSSSGEALKRLADRAQVEPLTIFVASLIQAQKSGIPLAEILKSQAASVRTYRRQKLEEQINKLPTKMIIPQLLIFASLLVGILAPAMYMLMQNFA